jgi:hypothetical protein
VTAVPRTTTPTQREISDLKRLTAGIIRVQGNRFIKDLLRKNDIRIGSNKTEFETNLNNAIVDGSLTMAEVSSWLQSVEGWGNQHVYLYNLSAALKRSLTETLIEQRVRAARLQRFWNRETTMAFPNRPELASISFADGVFRLVWHESSPGWSPEPGKNFTREEGLDFYEYRAYRRAERRAITRFEARVSEGIAALFIANPIVGEEHEAIREEARQIIARLMDLDALERGTVQIATVSKNLDQRNIPANTHSAAQVKAQKSRLLSGGSYVEFAASSPDKAYWEEPAVENVRKAVRDGQLQAFQGGEGIFVFQQGVPGLERALRVQLYGDDNRVRLWAQMDASEVWAVLKTLNAYQ